MRVPGRSPRRSRPAPAEEAAPFDPIALTLAIWLGLIATATGMVRMSENAAAQAPPRQPGTAQPLETPDPRILLGG